jgi:hypothetical protein
MRCCQGKGGGRGEVIGCSRCVSGLCVVVYGGWCATGSDTCHLWDPRCAQGIAAPSHAQQAAGEVPGERRSLEKPGGWLGICQHAGGDVTRGQIVRRHNCLLVMIPPCSTDMRRGAHQCLLPERAATCQRLSSASLLHLSQAMSTGVGQEAVTPRLHNCCCCCPWRWCRSSC